MGNCPDDHTVKDFCSGTSLEVDETSQMCESLSFPTNPRNPLRLHPPRKQSSQSHSPAPMLPQQSWQAAKGTLLVRSYASVPQSRNHTKGAIEFWVHNNRYCLSWQTTAATSKRGHNRDHNRDCLPGMRYSNFETACSTLSTLDINTIITGSLDKQQKPLSKESTIEISFKAFSTEITKRPAQLSKVDPTKRQQKVDWLRRSPQKVSRK